MTTTGSNETNFSPQHKNKIKQVLDAAVQGGVELPCIFESEIDALSILRWLAQSDAQRKLYWRGRDSEFEFGGCGIGFEIDEDKTDSNKFSAEEIIEMSPYGEELLFFYGQSFSGCKPTDASWTKFPSRISVIPEIMVVRRGVCFSLMRCLTISPGENIEDISVRATKLLSRRPAFDEGSVEMPSAEVKFIRHRPDYESWSENIGISLARISAGEIKKIVLARRTDISLKNKPNPVATLDRLIKENDNCYAILYQPEEGTTFISLSPERLFCLSDLRLETEAISSTVVRGKDKTEDEIFEKELVGSKKQKREHRYVVEGLGRAMRPICQSDPDVGTAAVLKLNRIQHLLTPVSGQLKKGIATEAVIGSLHPTAAVGGTPKAVAVPMIAKLEPFDRGWYAAPIGFISKNRSEFAVGIRSALISGNVISVFSGAGIVRGSTAESEWNEIESKNILRSFLPDEAKV